MTKYKEYCLQMLETHKQEFDEFRLVHDAYMLNASKHQDEFNLKGKPIMDIVKDWEDKLCSRSEGSGYGAFTEKLAEKFMEEVKRQFPMIDRVGLIIKKMKPIEKTNSSPSFNLNKINLSSNSFNLKKIGF